MDVVRNIPSLPDEGPLRVLALGGSIALLAFLASTLVLVVRSRRRAARFESSPTVWAAATFGVSLISFALGRLAPALHPIASAATFVLATRNTVRFSGAPRVLQAVGLTAWVIAIVAARALFGG